MFISFDDGGHWQPFQLNLPNVPINDIKIHDKDLDVATQGRSFWILDDLSPLEQITPTARQQSVTLFKPRDAYRIRQGGRGGGGGGRGGRGAADPAAPQYSPPGGVIDYLVNDVPAGGVRIDIADSTGKPVAAFSSEGSVALSAADVVGAAPTNSDDPAAAPAGGRGRGGPPPTRTLSKNSGMNRFYWDFVNQTNGQPVTPGLYQVTMTADGKKTTDPWRLLVDPRVAADGVTAADLREQYAHNVRMREMSAEVQRLQGRLQSAIARLGSTASGAQADTLAKAKAVLAKILDQQDAQGRPVRYGRPGIATHVRYLAGMTAGADQKIGHDAVERYQTLRKELDTLEAEADRAIGKG
jgi:hypothetical protein